MATPYLVANRPKRSQFRHPRRVKATGLTVVHTAESAMDALGPDAGAEAVAQFVRNRAEPGSYHDIADSDSVVQLVAYQDEAFQDGTGSNPIAMSISFACRTTDWSRMTPARRAAFLAQGAVAFARQQAWLRANGRPTTPLRRITRQQSEAGVAGFISHAERDPARRSDPGADFPWSEWFRACAAALDPSTSSRPTHPEQEDDVANTQKELVDAARIALTQVITEAATRSTTTGRAVARALDLLDTAPDADDLAAALAPRLAELLPDSVTQAAVETALRSVFATLAAGDGQQS